MQPRPTQAKPKYKIKDYAVSGSYAFHKLTYIGNDQSCKVYCICNNFQQNKAKKCSRCNQSYHSCVTGKSQDSANWVCLRCESKYMDPIYCPEQILLETFFKTQSVTQYGNIIQFIFYLTPTQIKKPVEIRGLQDGRSGLAWPMHGEYFLNKEQFPQAILDIKPLLKNSNRKYRKEQAFILPQEKLRVGKNSLIFSIPKLNPTTYQAKYQIENRGIYFIGIYSINKLTKDQLIQKTFLTSKLDKAASIQFLRTQLLGGGELSVEKSVICLECPYMKSRIKIPVRGKQCQHYTCICLDTLIQTRVGMSSRQWQCPICNSPINEPVIDMYVLSILNDGSAGIKVSLDATGKYEWMAFEDDNISLSSASSKAKKVVVPDKIQPPKPNIVQADKVEIIQAPKRVSMSVPLTQAIEKMKEKQKEKKEKEKEKETEKEKLLFISNINQKPAQLPISIDLDEDPPIDLPPPAPVEAAKPKNLAKRSNTTEDLKVSFLPLQIMVPEGKKSKFEKQKQLNLVKQKLKENLRMKKQKEMEMPAPKNYRREEFLITDVKELDLKPISFNDYCKKYFTLEYSRSKVNQDLKNIFKEVL